MRVSLSATIMTTEKHLVPVRFGIAQEDRRSWNIFLINLRQVLEEYCPKYDISNTVLMSDRNRALIRALKIQFPQCHRCFCARHLYDNVKRKIDGYCFWKAVEAPDENVFRYYWKKAEEKTDAEGKIKLEELKHLRDHWKILCAYQ